MHLLFTLNKMLLGCDAKVVRKMKTLTIISLCESYTLKLTFWEKSLILGNKPTKPV